MQDQPVLFVTFQKPVGEPQTQLSIEGSGLNVKRTRQSTARYPPRSKLPWIRELVLEAQSSDLMVSIFTKSQKRNKKAGGGEQAIRLVLIIVWAIVIVVLGFYAGLHLSHDH